MEKIRNYYETLFIVDIDLGEEGVEALISKFTNLIADNGEIREISKWGKRRLAYPINDKPEGFYVLVTFMSEGHFPAELERIFGITDGIMRSIVVRLDEKVVAASEARAKAVAAAAAEAAAKIEEAKAAQEESAPAEDAEPSQEAPAEAAESEVKEEAEPAAETEPEKAEEAEAPAAEEAE